MAAIFCLIDGMMDESFRFGDYPNMAALAEEGAVGTFTTVPPGLPVESYPCIASLLGIPAGQLPPLARGYLEALGAGLEIAEDDLVLRASWMRVEGEILAEVAEPPDLPLRLPPGCAYHALGSYKALLVLFGAAKSLPQILTFPPHACAGQPLQAVMPKGEARLVELVRLSRHQDRLLIPWGQAVACQLPPLRIEAAAVAAALIVRGLAKAMGIELFYRPGFSGDIDTDLAAKTRLALSLAGQYPLVFLHINGADEAAHRRDAAQKQAFLQKVDQTVIRALKAASLPMLICSDHGASPLSGRHLGGEQPFLLWGTAKGGLLGSLPAQQGLKLLLEERP